MHPEKKQQERKALELLSAIDPRFPRGRIMAGESPDFVIRTGTRQRTGIEVTRLTDPEASDYRDDRHFSPFLSRELLEGRIRAKESRLPLYRKKKLARIWLLILASGFSNSPAFNVSNQLNAWGLQTEFDRVVLLDQVTGKLYEVAARSSGHL